MDINLISGLDLPSRAINNIISMLCPRFRSWQPIIQLSLCSQQGHKIAELWKRFVPLELKISRGGQMESFSHALVKYQLKNVCLQICGGTSNHRLQWAYEQLGIKEIAISGSRRDEILAYMSYPKSEEGWLKLLRGNHDLMPRYLRALQIEDELNPSQKQSLQNAIAQACPQSPFLDRAPPGVLRDRHVLHLIVQRNGREIINLDQAYLDNDEFAEAAVRSVGDVLFSLSPRLQNKREMILLALSQNGKLLGQQHSSYWNDREAVKIAVTNYGDALIYAKEFRDDFEIVMLSVRNQGHAIIYASNTLQHNEEIVAAALASNGLALSRVKHVSNNRVMVLIAVRSCGLALQYASPDLRDDEVIVRAATENDGDAFRFASDRLKVLYPFVEKILAIKGDAFRHLNEEYRNDRNLLYIAMENFPEAFQFASDDLRNQMQAVHFAASRYEKTLQCTTLRDDSIVEIAVQKFGRMLQYANIKQKDTSYIVTLAAFNDGTSIEFASKAQQNLDSVKQIAKGSCIILPGERIGPPPRKRLKVQ